MGCSSVIAATNKDLMQLVKEGKFREDLYYRLAAMSLTIPSLQKRHDDLKPLADYFLRKWCKRRNRTMSIAPEVYEKMKQYLWPGNVRELKNVIQFSAYLCHGDVITELNLPKNVVGKEAVAPLSYLEGGTLKEIITDTERRVIKSRLEQYGDSFESKKLVAKMLGISLATLYNKAR